MTAGFRPGQWVGFRAEGHWMAGELIGVTEQRDWHWLVYCGLTGLHLVGQQELHHNPLQRQEGSST